VRMALRTVKASKDNKALSVSGQFQYSKGLSTLESVENPYRQTLGERRELALQDITRTEIGVAYLT